MRKILYAQFIGIMLMGQALASDPTVVVLEPEHFQAKFRVTMKSGDVKEQPCENEVPTPDEIEQFLKAHSEVASAEVIQNIKPSEDVRTIVIGKGFYRRKVKDQEVQAAVKLFPNATCVDISFRDVEDLGHFSGLRGLEKLILNGTNQDRLNMLATMRSLTDLELSNMDLKRVPVCLKELGLRRLVLSKNSKLNFAGAPQLTTVEELDIGSLSVKEYSFLVDFVPNVKALNIYGNRYVEAFKSKWFSKLGQLNSLKARDARISTDALSVIVQGAPYLTFLDISCNGRGDANVLDLSVLQPLSELIELDLSWNGITSTELEPLEDLESLSRLDVSHNDRNGESAMLSRLPRDCSKFTHLSAAGLGLKSLYGIPLGRFKVLQYLDVSSHKNGICLDGHSVKLIAGTLTSLAIRNMTMSEQDFANISLLTKLEELDMNETKVGGSWKKALVKLPLKKLTLNKQEGRVYTGTDIAEFLGK